MEEITTSLSLVPLQYYRKVLPIPCQSRQGKPVTILYAPISHRIILPWQIHCEESVLCRMEIAIDNVNTVTVYLEFMFRKAVLKVHLITKN